MAYRKFKRLLFDRKRKICELDAESIAYYRRNPCIAIEYLLGIRLIDSQNTYYKRAGINHMFYGAVVETLVNHFWVQFS